MGNTSGEKELKTDWPHVSGLQAGVSTSSSSETQNGSSTFPNNGDIDPSDEGCRIYVNLACSLVSVTKTPAHDGASVALYTDAYDFMASGSYVGDVATFATAQDLTAGTYYRIESEGPNSTRWSNQSSSFPYVNDYVNFTGGSIGGGNDAAAWNFPSITISTPAIETEPTKQEGRQSNLVAEKGSFVPRRKKVGL